LHALRAKRAIAVYDDDMGLKIFVRRRTRALIISRDADTFFRIACVRVRVCARIVRTRARDRKSCRPLQMPPAKAFSGDFFRKCG